MGEYTEPTDFDENTLKCRAVTPIIETEDNRLYRDMNVNIRVIINNVKVHLVKV